MQQKPVMSQEVPSPPMATIAIHAVALLLPAALFTWIERRWSAQPALRLLAGCGGCRGGGVAGTA